MSFSLKELLDQQKIQQLTETKVNHVGTQKYAVSLSYEKHTNGQPIHTQICKV